MAAAASATSAATKPTVEAVWADQGGDAVGEQAGE